MMKLATSLLLIALACLPPAGLAEPARRIVSLDMCTDWMLATYARRESVAALSPLSRRYTVPWLDAGWPVHDGTLERILQLKPDLVITGQYNAVLLRGRLKALGVRVEVLALPTSLAEVTAYEERLLVLLGQPVDMASKAVAASGSAAARKRVLLLGANGIGTGQATFENDILERAGWANYLQSQGHVRLDLEQVVSDPPDAVLWASPAGNALANQFAQHSVLRRTIAPSRWLATDYWRWECPGPWTWDLVRQLNQWRN